MPTAAADIFALTGEQAAENAMVSHITACSQGADPAFLGRSKGYAGCPLDAPTILSLLALQGSFLL
jgi:hypothetical protein